MTLLKDPYMQATQLQLAKARIKSKSLQFVQLPLKKRKYSIFRRNYSKNQPIQNEKTKILGSEIEKSERPELTSATLYLEVEARFCRKFSNFRKVS